MYNLPGLSKQLHLTGKAIADIYLGKITNWNSSHDAAVLKVNFTLPSPTAVAFNFIFGSIEFPQFTNNFTDAAYVFLDGKQITFDKTAIRSRSAAALPAR